MTQHSNSYSSFYCGFGTKRNRLSFSFSTWNWGYGKIGTTLNRRRLNDVVHSYIFAIMVGIQSHIISVRVCQTLGKLVPLFITKCPNVSHKYIQAYLIIRFFRDWISVLTFCQYDLFVPLVFSALSGCLVSGTVYLVTVVDLNFYYFGSTVLPVLQFLKSILQFDLIDVLLS